MKESDGLRLMTIIALNNERRSVKSKNILQHCSSGLLECYSVSLGS